MYKNRFRGFTLIELLVVIAIIGILSAVVLASLSTARQKGQDAAIQSDLSTIQTQAELYYANNGNSYGSQAWINTTDVACAGGMFSIDLNVKNALAGAYTASGSLSGNLACFSDGQKYVVIVKEVSKVGKYWCVDSTGVAREVSSIASVTQCQ